MPLASRVLYQQRASLAQMKGLSLTSTRSALCLASTPDHLILGSVSSCLLCHCVH